MLLLACELVENEELPVLFVLMAAALLLLLSLLSSSSIVAVVYRCCRPRLFLVAFVFAVYSRIVCELRAI